MEAFFLTGSLFVFLTAFAMQTRRNFIFMHAALYAVLHIMIFWGLMRLFFVRTPLSEACRGVVTALAQLGLTDELREARRTSDLSELRRWFSALDRHEYLERVFVDARLKYAVMTNIPFAPEEARHWLGGDGAAPPPLTPRLKTALRVDPLLAGDWIGICAALSRAIRVDPRRRGAVASSKGTLSK